MALNPDSAVGSSPRRKPGSRLREKLDTGLRRYDGVEKSGGPEAKGLSTAEFRLKELADAGLDFKGALAELESRKESRIHLGLDRVFYVLNQLGNPQEKLEVIHVAGTNAKGSICKMLHSIFCAAGYPAGAYYSPHLYSPLERIQTRDGVISAKDFARLYGEILKVLGQEALTYFEIFTVLAYLYFAEKKINPVVLETGLGGRLDATNAPRHPKLTIITSIGLDHTQWLGKNLSQIALEKGGIFKQGVPALVGQVEPGVRKVLAKRAREVKVKKISFLKPYYLKSKSFWEEGKQEFFWRGEKFLIPMLGRHQIANAQLVLEAVEYLKRQGFELNKKSAYTGLAQARIPGRWELRFIGCLPWCFDVGHNPQAVKAFLETLTASPWSGAYPKIACVSFMKDKDYRTMIAMLKPYFEEIVFVPIDSDRAASLGDLRQAFLSNGSKDKNAFSNRGFTAKHSFSEAFHYLKSRRDAKFILVLGSFRLVAPMLANLE